MIKEAIEKIVNKKDLTYDEAYTVMNEIMSGASTPTQNAAFLAALSTKSARAETTDEIAGCAAAMRDHAIRVDAGMEVFEIVGTGGDNAHSFNISTTSALICAAGGMKVAKHGNRAASSQCGTADCLEALGVNIEQTPEQCVRLLEETGICFFFAQKYHTSMKYVGATNWFIRGPFLAEGIIIGIISAGISVGVSAAMYSKIVDMIGNQIFSMISMPMVPVGFLTYNFTWIFLALGISIGACGSIISMRKFLDA